MARRLALFASLALAVGCGSDREPSLPGPDPRGFPAGAFDRANQRLLLYAPSDENRAEPAPDGTWAFDGEAWRRADAFGPPAREAAGMVFDEARGAALMFGGERVRASETTDETWAFRGTGWRRLEVDGPVARHSPAMAYDSARGGTWMYGGFESCLVEECQALWFFDGEAWRRVD